MDIRITKNSIFRPYNFFNAIVIIIGMVCMGNVFPFEYPDQNSHDCSISRQDDDLNAPEEKGFSAKNVNSVIVDEDNTKWFCTASGIISFDGKSWKHHEGIKKLPHKDLKGTMYVDSPEGGELWIASPKGATVFKLPIEDKVVAKTLKPGNSGVLSKEVLGIAAGNNSIRWVGTDKGVSALSSDKWLASSYDMHYPKKMFAEFPITSMVTNLKGDSLYVGTAGAGIARIYKDNVDGISGASVYAQWGPILLPSDNIRCIFIAQDGTKWFGTDEGIAKHTGNDTLDNWTIYTTDDGLVDNFVQAISGDNEGNIWFGTKEGISVFNGSTWNSYTTEHGLAGNNVLSMITDHDGTVWIGTDTGITCYQNEKFINY